MLLLRDLLAVFFVHAALVAAVPTTNAWRSLEVYHSTRDHNNAGHEKPPPRPHIPIEPNKPRRPLPSSPARMKTCYVHSHNDTVSDDSSYILKAIHECNHGGHVVFSADNFYVIGTALNLKSLKHIDIDIQGYIQFTNDTDYWQAHAFKQTYQNATTFFQLGGEDVNVYGGGTIDGNGQVWYDLYAADIYILRPILFGTIGLHGGSISNLNFVQTPQWFNFVANSSDVVFSNLHLSAVSSSSNVAENTDGWDIYRSSYITIQNSTIVNGDDCVSFKPNTTDTLVQGLHCTGSHGISVGSLGQYLGETDIVENLLIYNVTMVDSGTGARIKVWPGVPSELSGDLQGGGGTGIVKNVIYDTMHISNVDYAIQVTQCYGQSNQSLCDENPVSLSPMGSGDGREDRSSSCRTLPLTDDNQSSLEITDVLFKNFDGTTSKAYEPVVGTLVCSSPTACSDIKAQDINIVSPEDTSEWTCVNVEESTLALNCTS